MTTRDTMTTAASMPPGRTFISCDWGTSAFRLRVIDSTGPTPKVISTLTTAAGIAATHTDWLRSGLAETERAAFYRAVLESAIGQLADTSHSSGADLHSIPVVISGMASSSIGMLELPYKPLPLDVSGIDLTPAVLPATKGSPRVLYLLPGVRSADDVMRGEETQLIGAIATNPAEGIFLFPGTHSKHIHVRDGQAVDFKTYMTGELFGLLFKQSILAASVAGPDEARSVAASVTPRDAGSLPDAFFAGIAAARDASLLHNAFLTRTNQLFKRYSKEDNYHYLSGLLIGEELRALPAAPEPRELAAAPPTLPKPAGTEPSWATPPLTLVASSPLRESYAAALAFLGFRQIAAIDADAALIAGHSVLFTRFGATIASST